MSKSLATKPGANRGRRPGVLGVTSDGVEVQRPVRGNRNLSDAQVRAIVRGLVEARRRRLLPDGAE